MYLNMSFLYILHLYSKRLTSYDMLVSQLRPNSKGLYMITDKQTAKHPFLDIKGIRNNLGHEIASCLPVLHAISGCDTTSKLFGIGKSTVMNKKKSFS